MENKNQEQSITQSTSTESHETNSKLLIALLAIILIALVVIVFFLLDSNSNKTETEENLLDESSIDRDGVEETAEDPQESDSTSEYDYVLNYRKTEIPDESSPEVILNIPESDLKRFGCSLRYDAYNEVGTVTYKNYETNEVLEDENLLTFIDQRSSELEADPNAQYKSIVNITHCITENGDQLYILNESIQDVMLGGIASFIFISDSDERTVLYGETPSTNPYWRCSYTLAITKDNIAYISCGGGDGSFGEWFRFKADFNNNTVERIEWCTSEYNFETEARDTNCK